MPTVVGLVFEPAGMKQHYSPGDLTLEVGDQVMADTVAGPRLAEVVMTAHDVLEGDVSTGLRSVIRIASAADIAQSEANLRLEERARAVVPEKIAQLDLPMKLVDVDSDWDGTRITVFFAAEGRVDFRELVRVLAGALNVRVQMHQLGARDHAKMVGGLATCGRQVCCASWMKVFEPVSMRMAKDQSLFLNPTKFSGNCGKLKCCLRYEYDSYADAIDAPPDGGDRLDGEPAA